MGFLVCLRDRSVKFRTTLYADDVAIFIAPNANEIYTTTQILLNFGNASGQETNFEINTVLPIRCDHIDLDTVLQDLPTIRSSFPIKYLGLPLTYRRLCRVDYQPLLDKVGGGVGRDAFCP